MSDVFVVPAFMDLKLKQAGGGGFSDGGVVNESKVLKEENGNPVVVEVAPRIGEALTGIALESENGPAGVNAVNFSTEVVAIAVQEIFVEEDGTESVIGSQIMGPLETQSVTNFFENGGVLQYPNKLRYRLDPDKEPVPAGRVLLKYTLMRLDRPYDQSL